MADQVNVTVNAGGGQAAPPKQSGCARYTKGCVLVLIALAVIGAIRAKMKEGKPLETGVPTAIKDLKAEKKGTNTFSLKFHAAKGTDDVASDGDLNISLRPWTGTGVGDEIAVVNAKVTQANFSRDAIGDPELSMDLSFSPRAEMPPLTAWLQADVTFTPVGGGPLKESTKFIHDAIGPPGSGASTTTTPTATTPGASPTAPDATAATAPPSPAAPGGIEDVSVLFEDKARYKSATGKFKIKFAMCQGDSKGGYLILVTSPGNAESNKTASGKQKGTYFVMPFAVAKPYENRFDAMAESKENYVIEVKPDPEGGPPIMSSFKKAK